MIAEAIRRGRRLRRGGRALTLIEMLTVVAILALLITVLILFILPSDDRKCRMEAERLAAYLTGAAAEAVMRDGPLRVAFDLDEQQCHREIIQIGADIRQRVWHAEENPVLFKTRSPVRITTLATPSAEVTNGLGWLPFDRGKTAGGVAVLELEEAVYSVIVPQHGDIRVERGRAPLPPRTGPLVRPLMAGEPFDLSAMGEMGMGPSGGGGEPPMEEPQQPPPIGEPEAPPPAEPEPEAEPPPPEPEPEPEPEAPPAEPEPDPPPPPDAGMDEPDAAPEGECTTNEECEGYLQICHEKQCILDPSRQAFRGGTILVGQPANALLRETIQNMVNERIADGRFNLLMQFEGPAFGTPGPDQKYWVWTMQGLQAGGGAGMPGYIHDPRLPTYRHVAEPISCPPSYQLCFEVRPAAGEPLVDIYLEKQPDPNTGCAFRKLTARATTQIMVRVGSGPHDTEASMSLTGIVTREHAASFDFPWRTPGGAVIERSLDELLEEQNIPPEFDSTGDSLPDAWRFGFDSTGQQVQLFSDPSMRAGMPPDGCGW